MTSLIVAKEIQTYSKSALHSLNDEPAEIANGFTDLPEEYQFNEPCFFYKNDYFLPEEYSEPRVIQF